MARKLRWALISLAALAALGVGILWAAYFAARQVRPFYHEALAIDAASLEAGSRELETRASALYSDTRQVGKWHAQFTDEQINGWLATQLRSRAESDGKLTSNVGEPRIALRPGMLSLGFRTIQGGIDTVISVDAAVSLTAEGAVAIQLKSVRAGALPLPVMQVADEISAACQQLNLPVRWTHSEGQPIAIIEIANDVASRKRMLYLDAIELHDGELYVAGRTEASRSNLELSEEDELNAMPEPQQGTGEARASISLAGYELRLAPAGKAATLEIGAESTESPEPGEPAATR